MFYCTDFTNVILTNVNLSNANLNGAVFCKADFQGVDFEILPDLIGHSCPVVFANFSHDEKYIVSLDKANMKMWNFEKYNLMLDIFDFADCSFDGDIFIDKINKIFDVET